MATAMVGAARLARSNRHRRDALVDRHRALEELLADEAALMAGVRGRAYAALVDVTAFFARVRGAELRALAAAVPAQRSSAPCLDVPSLRPEAAAVLGVAGGAAAGSAAGALAVSAVGALATASTGTAISGLSGAAASSATLAWLGGGSLAAGGGGVAAGTTVLVGVVAAPVALTAVAVAEWQGRRLRRAQTQTAEEIAAVDAALTVDEGDAAAVVSTSAEERGALGALTAVVRRFLPAMLRVVEASEDYAAWTPSQRRIAGALASAATCIADVMASATGAVDRARRCLRLVDHLEVADVSGAATAVAPARATS